MYDGERCTRTSDPETAASSGAQQMAVEPLLRSAIRIMAHMQEQGFGVVSVPRKDLEARPGITPNYVMRALATMPRFEGTTNIPSIDNVFADRLRPAEFQFAMGRAS